MKKALFIIALILICSCDGKEDREVNCSNVLCAADQFLITFRDASGVSLIGTQFVKDSFKLSSANSVQYVKPIPFGDPEDLAIFYGKVESDSKYAIQLSTTETDTLRFTFSTEVGSCCTTSTMEELLFNGTENTSEEDNFYVFIRD